MNPEGTSAVITVLEMYSMIRYTLERTNRVERERRADSEVCSVYGEDSG